MRTMEIYRTEHLNSGEKKLLFKICKNYNDIFYKEGTDLSFTNEVKHRIRTVDDIPIHVKSNRYPYVQI